MANVLKIEKPFITRVCVTQEVKPCFHPVLMVTVSLTLRGVSTRLGRKKMSRETRRVVV